MIYIIPTDTCFWIACGLDDCKSYNEIYEIKKREFSKPLAIMVKDFKWLEKNTILNEEQIDFLKNYEKPFTILTDCTNIKALLNFEDEEFNFVNKDEYKLIAFRVAHNDIQKKLIDEVGPIFLTSANISNNPEIYSSMEIEKEFSYYLKNNKVKFLNDDISELEKKKTSDIFEFVWESLEVNYLRKS